jgi:hypothetical protein
MMRYCQLLMKAPASSGTTAPMLNDSPDVQHACRFKGSAQQVSSRGEQIRVARFQGVCRGGGIDGRMHWKFD